MCSLKTIWLLCIVLLSTETGVSFPVMAQESPPVAQIPAPAKPHPEVQRLLDSAALLTKEFKWHDALERYKEARKKAQNLQDRAGEAIALGNIGIIHKDTGQPQKALEFYQQALLLFQAI